MTLPSISVLLLLVVVVPLAFIVGCQRADVPLEEKKPVDEEKPVAEPAGPAAAPVTHAANRLADETSLYLRMHAHNPVDWYPWGEEALEKARAEGKLIFLSVGYSSCYWCHVMERNTFMDEEAAAVLNAHFVAIKVDREERPDIDQIYMAALQVYFQLIGSPQSGGWPLTMLLTPDGRPLMCGTYFPPRNTDRMPGLIPILEKVQQFWQDDPEKMRENSQLLARFVKQRLQQQSATEEAPLDARLLDGVRAALSDQYDPEYGGFGFDPMNFRVPKFPEPSNLVFLLDRARRDRNGGEKAEDESGGKEQTEAMLVGTLERMADGGIRDHVGGGFHRYSTDRSWRIPHFEKMLYDNAQLASVYAEAYRLTGREEFRHVVERILRFVSREMTGPDGGFYSAIDAETDAEEGRFYVWQRDELTEVLDPPQFQLLADVYGIGENGNFEGRHVLLLPRTIEETAAMRETTAEELRRQLDPIHQKLLDARNGRQRPLTDTKILTAWSGLMIRGFADAGRALDDPRYVETAEKAADFVLEKLRTPEGRLLRTFGAGRAKLNAYLDDYAFLVDGLIALHRATGEQRWLEEADRLTAIQIESFWDEDRGGFFFTSDDHETLLARSKDPTDSVLPSGNAVSAGNLVYLAGELNKPEYLDRAERTLRAFAPLLEEIPSGMPRMAVSLAALLEARG